jgi:hypothetical protein
MTTHHRTGSIACAALLSLAACGGGGGDTPAPTSYAALAAQRHLLTEAGSWTMTGAVAGGSSYTVNLAFAPQSAQAFAIGGVVASRSKQTITVTQDGTLLPGIELTHYFDAANLAFIGTDNGDGTCSVATANAALPSDARPGDKEVFVTESERNLCADGSGVVGTTTIGWSLEADTGIVLLCWTSTAQDAVGAAVDAAVSSCVEIDADGSLGSKARLSISAFGQSTTARNF